MVRGILWGLEDPDVLTWMESSSLPCLEPRKAPFNPFLAELSHKFEAYREDAYHHLEGELSREENIVSETPSVQDLGASLKSDFPIVNMLWWPLVKTS
jgi:hypothetical protein